MSTPYLAFDNYGERVKSRPTVTLYIVGAVIALASVIGSLVAVAKLLEDR